MVTVMAEVKGSWVLGSSVVVAADGVDIGVVSNKLVSCAVVVAMVVKYPAIPGRPEMKLLTALINSKIVA